MNILDMLKALFVFLGLLNEGVAAAKVEIKSEKIKDAEAVAEKSYDMQALDDLGAQ